MTKGTQGAAEGDALQRAAQRALDWMLDQGEATFDNSGMAGVDVLNSIVGELRASLASKVQPKGTVEPAAWKWHNKVTGAQGCYFEDPAKFMSLEHPDYEWTKLYTHPAQAPAPVPHPLQGACRYISDVLTSDATTNEKRIAREIMYLLPLVSAPAPDCAVPCAAVGEADAAPQAEREPLTKEQVFRALQAAAWPFPLPARNFDPLHFARAIERAHGIGEAQPPVQGNDK